MARNKTGHHGRCTNVEVFDLITQMAGQYRDSGTRRGFVLYVQSWTFQHSIQHGQAGHAEPGPGCNSARHLPHIGQAIDPG